MCIPVTDAGFVLGVTVAEQLRTFRGSLFRLERHLSRLNRSLEIVGVQLGLGRQQLVDAAHELVRHNHRLLADGDDLGLSIFVTPGPYSTFVPQGGQPTVGMHTYPLPFRIWERKYQTGQTLLVTDVQQVPEECWPAELKCRSRMHYYLADHRAAEIDPQARALLTDRDGFVIEASTANLVLWRPHEGLISPPEEKILPGVSVSVLRELAEGLGWNFVHRPIRPEDVVQSDEAFLTSTSPCIIPVTRVQGRPLGTGQPGPVFGQLLQAWNGLVGLDIVGQAQQFAAR
jgi:branched-chain amino acid aminotransferase